MCAHALTHTQVHLCPCVWQLGDNLGYCSAGTAHLIFQDRVFFSPFWQSSSRPDWLATRLQGPTSLCLQHFCVGREFKGSLDLAAAALTSPLPPQPSVSLRWASPMGFHFWSSVAILCPTVEPRKLGTAASSHPLSLLTSLVPS